MGNDVLEQHIGLTAASCIAFDQISQRTRQFYDAEHLTEVLNMVAHALAHSAPI